MLPPFFLYSLLSTALSTFPVSNMQQMPNLLPNKSQLMIYSYFILTSPRPHSSSTCDLTKMVKDFDVSVGR